jgi:hypothetical protein
MRTVNRTKDAAYGSKSVGDGATTRQPPVEMRIKDFSLSLRHILSGTFHYLSIYKANGTFF